MIVRDLHILAEKQFAKFAPGVRPDDRETQRLYLTQLLRELRDKEDWTELIVKSTTVATTVVDQRNYTLAAGTPNKFMLLKIDIGASEPQLTYEPPEIFFERDFSAETSGQPSHYTIISLTSTTPGRKELWISPKPSTANWTLTGIHTPQEWELDEASDLPPFENTGILLWGLLRQMLPGHQYVEGKYAECLKDLYLRSARTRSGQLTPAFSKQPYSNDGEVF